MPQPFNVDRADLARFNESGTYLLIFVVPPSTVPETAPALTKFGTGVLPRVGSRLTVINPYGMGAFECTPTEQLDSNLSIPVFLARVHDGLEPEQVAEVLREYGPTRLLDRALARILA